MTRERQTRRGRRWRAAVAGLEPAHLAAWRAFLRTHATIVRRIEADLAAAGPDILPLDWYDVLVPLADHPARRMRMWELADAVVLSRVNLTRRVDRLEAAGLLRREPVPTDRRGAYAVLTDAGLAALRRTWPHYGRAIVARFGRRLSTAEAEQLAALLDRLRTMTAPGLGPV
jgi:DNA-binding MarR family transcriptional regulator